MKTARKTKRLRASAIKINVKQQLVFKVNQKRTREQTATSSVTNWGKAIV